MPVEIRNMPEARLPRIGSLNAGDVPSARGQRSNAAAGAAGALLGSRIAGTRISPETLRRIFAATVLAISAYRIARFFF